MGALRNVGGILSLISGILVLLIPLAILFNLPLLNAIGLEIAFGPIPVYINLLIACLAIVGGILGLMKAKKAGGVLALVAAVMWVLGGALHHYLNLNVLIPYSLILLVWAGVYWWIFTVEAILVLLGSIFILVDRSEKQAL
jgi:hypothetical protein